MKNKKNIIMIIVICLLGVGIGYLLFNSSDNGLVELNYNELTTKIENKEDFVVCISVLLVLIVMIINLNLEK